MGAGRVVVALALTSALAACTLPTGDPTASPTPAAGPAGSSAAPPPSGAADAPPEEPFVFVRVDDVLEDAELAALAALPGVAAVTADRTDDVALLASRRADGTPVDDLPTGFKISLAGLVDDGDTAGLEAPLAAGELAMTTRGTTFRDLDVGAVVTLADGVERTVVAVVDDASLADVEVVLAEADAAALGFRGRQRARLVLADDADPGAVAEAAAATLDGDAVVQPRVPDGRPFILSLPETKARFGEFAFKDLTGRDVQAGASWIEANIVTAQVPLIGRVVCHRLIVEPLTAALQDIADAGIGDQVDPALFGGCWAPRRINRNANLSRHAWGIAVDINVDFAAPGLGPIPSEEVIAAFARHGFRWGGEYPVPDNHHFEWVGLPAG